MVVIAANFEDADRAADARAELARRLDVPLDDIKFAALRRPDTNEHGRAILSADVPREGLARARTILTAAGASLLLVAVPYHHLIIDELMP